MAFTIAAVADIHYTSSATPHPARRGEIADVLLQQAVQRINATIKPEVTVVLGDLLDDGQGAAAMEQLQHLRTILDRLTSPSIILPGNHDGDLAQFYRVMPRPAPVVDIGDVRLLPFFDAEEPDYNSRRSVADCARMSAARAGYAGQILSLQHVPLLPPGQGASPYRLVNAVGEYRYGEFGSHEDLGLAMMAAGVAFRNRAAMVRRSMRLQSSSSRLWCAASTTRMVLRALVISSGWIRGNCGRTSRCCGELTQ
jgi:hypothetical protein